MCCPVPDPSSVHGLLVNLLKNEDHIMTGYMTIVSVNLFPPRLGIAVRCAHSGSRAASVAAWRPVSRAGSGTVRYGGGMGRAAPARSEAAASSQEPFASAVTLAAAASMCRGSAQAAYPKSIVKGV